MGQNKPFKTSTVFIAIFIIGLFSGLFIGQQTNKSTTLTETRLPKNYDFITQRKSRELCRRQIIRRHGLTYINIL